MAITLRATLRSKRGAALVEMAIVAPLLILLIFGGIDVGLMLRDYLSLNQVAREAVRSASVGSTTSSVSSSVNTWASNLGLNAASVTMTAQYINSGIYSLGDSGGANNAPMGSEVMVTLSYPHQMIFTQLLSFGPSVQMKASMVMRRE